MSQGNSGLSGKFGPLAAVQKGRLKASVPDFRAGDTVRVHAKIVEGTKERIQVFEGVVIKRHKGNSVAGTFTVRKVSYNVGVERTFYVHSPRVEKIEVVSRGVTRRAKLFHLRALRGKAARIKSKYSTGEDLQTQVDSSGAADVANGATTNGSASSVEHTETASV